MKKMKALNLKLMKKPVINSNNVDKVKPYKSIRQNNRCFLISVLLIIIFGTVSYNRFAKSIIESSESSTMNTLDFMGILINRIYTQKSSARDFVLDRSLIDYYAVSMTILFLIKSMQRSITDSIVQLQLTSKFISEVYYR